MKSLFNGVFAGAFAALALGGAALAQQAAASAPFAPGMPVGVRIDGFYTPASSNVRVYGGVVNAESCVYDETRNLIVVVNRGANQDQAPNDGYVSLLNSDGSVHTPRWIGATRNGLVLNHPFGSEIHNGKLYLADRDGGTADGAPSVSVIRMFDMVTAAPAGEIRTPDSGGFNDIAIAADGTIYATQTGNPTTPMRVYRIAPNGTTSIFIDGGPLKSPNGIGIDNDGNIVVLNMGSDEVLTFSPTAQLIKTERAAQPGSDGLVIMPDGTKYVSSVQQGGISRIRPNEPPFLVATGIPNAASMCYDTRENQLVVPMNPNNAVALVRLPAN